MANYEINEEQEVLTKAMRMIETGDPVHADVYNALFSALLNNDVFLEKLANKMVQQAMVSHVMDSTNSNMVLGADQGPVITKLIDKVQEQVTVLNTKMPAGNKKIYFDGHVQTFGVRSGENGLNNVYLDFLDENGTHCYIGFMTEGTKGVVFYSGGKLVWKISV